MSQAVRQRSFEWVSIEGCAPPLSERSGLEFFRALAEGRLPPQPITETIGWTVLEAEKGLLRLGFEPKEYQCHAGGLVHGGVIATLLDSAMSGAVMTQLEKGQGCTTLSLNVQTIRGIRPGDGLCRVEGRVTSIGRRVGVATGQIMDAAGKLLAQATTTCLVFDI